MTNNLASPGPLTTGQAPADDAAHLLVVDDDRRIRALLLRYLLDHGYRVTTAGNAKEARAALKSLSFDLIVLDVMMPGENGFDLVSSLRQETQVPVLMLTARADPTDRVIGLERGADDYLSKPFEPRELLLRIASILRRAQPRAVERGNESVRFGDFIFDIGRGDLRHKDEVIRLTDREREMLRMLAAQPGETVSREALAGTGAPANERTVDVQVNRLRRKIERDPANPIHLQTVRGIGYRLLADR
jgi:two-component system phosphate regulon response regulator OmpR